MRMLLGSAWSDDFLDYHCGESECRVTVESWVTLRRVDDMYFEASPDILRVITYIREVGFREVWRRVRSRRSERGRNDKYVSVGIGTVVDAGPSAQTSRGMKVAFVAPSHPRCVERVVLTSELVRRLPDSMADDREAGLEHVDATTEEMPPEVSVLAGWSRHSGIEISRQDVDVVVAHGLQLLKSAHPAQRRSADHEETATRSALKRHAPTPGKPTGVVLGLGHYAKIVIIPNVTRSIEIAAVHDVDPVQLQAAGQGFATISTAPAADEDGMYDAHFLSGFHHTHAPLAVKAIAKGAYAVSEKPLVTTWEQREELLHVLASRPDRFFACFQKRYSPFNPLAMRDLGASPGDPVHYHSIVYEVKLPRRHWYTWPNSGSRIISNGCHWIDHFLFLNEYSAVRSCDAWGASNGDVTCVAELVNGASFSMVLTDQGSSRIGVQEYIELTSRGPATVRIRNNNYEAEDSRKLIRRRRSPKMAGHVAMYRFIGQQIARGAPGDSVESVRRTTELMLLLEDALVARKGAGALNAHPA